MMDCERVRASVVGFGGGQPARQGSIPVGVFFDVAPRIYSQEVAQTLVPSLFNV
jgi:hypothetical protein